MKKNVSVKNGINKNCINFFIITIVTLLYICNSADASETEGKILVATNRYVILDDWTTSASLGPGFSLPGATHNSNSWSLINTKINATALFIDNTGSPLSGRQITFYLYQPNNAEYTAARVNATTNAYGLANFSFDMDARAYYGNWTIKAVNGSLSDNTSFIYNWWGCGIGGCRSGHSSENPSGTATQNSPYLSRRDSTVGLRSDHETTCTNCHQSFDGKQGSNSAGGSQHTNNPSDVHRNLTCNNVNCHQTIISHRSNAVIGSCFSSTCHTPANRTDISNKSTLSGVLSSYSYNNGSTFNSTFHTPTSTVPCFICHGPMHNISKPDRTQRYLRNSDTESTHCQTCHTSYSRHNNGVNCTVCHSDDIHAIKVFAQNAIYITLNKSDPNSYRGNCTNCHQNATFFSILKNQSRAGSHAGANPPQIPIRINHSTDNAGSKWGNFWSTPYTACIYCHGDNKHNATRLGNISVPVGTDTIGGPIGNGTVCSSCHNSSDNDYAATMNLLVPDPVANRPGPNWNVSGMDHASYGGFDSDCKKCHGGALSESAGISEFAHNVAVGDLVNCIGCHNSDQGIYAAINSSLFGKHSNVNGSDGSNNLTNDDCKTCHSNTTDMMTTGFTVTTKTCPDCHNTTGTFAAPTISNHRPNGVNILTSIYCSVCHNNSINMFANGTNASVSHYNTRTNLVKPTAGTYNTACNNCHNSTLNKTLYGVENKQITMPHTRSATCDKCHVNSSSTAQDLHNISLEFPVTTNCRTCHTTYADKYGAPNITGTFMGTKTACQGSSCHGDDITNSLDTLAKHNVDRTYSGIAGQTNTVYLNNQDILTITRGIPVSITSQVNDYWIFGNTASRVAGAEYYIDTDPGVGKGIPMSAQDGYFNAVDGNWENITANIDTSNLSGGNHTIFVRGRDIGKQWSATKNATLIIQTFGYINGTVTNGTAHVTGALISAAGVDFTTGSDGYYSLMVTEGIYTVSAKKQPEFNDYSVTDKIVTPMNTTSVDIIMDQKPTGTISGFVGNV